MKFIFRTINTKTDDLYNGKQKKENVITKHERSATAFAMNMDYRYSEIVFKGIEQMKIKMFDLVRLKDGRIGSVVDINGNESVDLDVGDSPEDWETLWGVPIDDIEEVINN